MSELKAQSFYQRYRALTVSLGYSPIGRQRFTGIIRTICDIPETIKYISKKQWVSMKNKHPDEGEDVLFRSPDHKYVCGFILGITVFADGQIPRCLHEMDDWYWKPIPE